MGWFDDDSEEYRAHDNITKHKAELSHEAMSGAAAFFAAREYEKHVEKNGHPVNHAVAKELLAGFAGAFIDREVETRGLDFFDSEKAKHEAKKRAEEAWSNSPDYERASGGY